VDPLTKPKVALLDACLLIGGEGESEVAFPMFLALDAVRSQSGSRTSQSAIAREARDSRFSILIGYAPRFTLASRSRKCTFRDEWRDGCFFA